MLEPMLKVFDGDRRMLEWVKGKDAPGKTVMVVMAPAPNTTLFLQISGFADSAGLYTLKVTPLKAFDAYEPNDEIFNARAIEIGKTINANIMDKSDTDYIP